MVTAHTSISVLSDAPSQRAENAVVILAVILVLGGGVVLTELGGVALPIHTTAIPTLSYVWGPLLLLTALSRTLATGPPQSVRVYARDAVLGGCLALWIILEVFTISTGSSPKLNLIYSYAWVLFFIAFFRVFGVVPTNRPEMQTLVHYIALCGALLSFILITVTFIKLQSGQAPNYCELNGEWPVFSYLSSNCVYSHEFKNTFSYAAAFSAVCSLWLALICRGARRTLGTLCLVLCTFAIALNKSRGAWLALLLCAMFLVSWFARRRLTRTTILWAASGCVVAIATLAVVAPRSFELALTLGRGASPQLENELRGRADTRQGSVSMRLEMVASGLKSFVQAPVFGQGLLKTEKIKVSGHSLHGLWLVSLSSYGLLGMVPLFALLMPRWGRNEDPDTVALKLTILLLACVVTFAATDPPFWFALAFLLLSAAEARSD